MIDLRSHIRQRLFVGLSTIKHGQRPAAVKILS
jgi:hypothetical protein